jgi:hypothetical protein
MYSYQSLDLKARVNLLFNSGKWKLRRYLCTAGRMQWVFACASVCDSVSTICAKASITYIRVTMPAPNVLAADIFWTVYFLLTSRAIKQALATYPAPPFSFVSFHFLALQVSRHGNWTVVCFHLVDSKGTEKKHSGPDTVHIHSCKHCGVSLRK